MIKQNSNGVLLDLFKDRQVWVATMHGKEEVIGPQVERELGAIWTVPKNFDTDQFGSFSGEVQRKGNAFDAAKEKCEQVLRLHGGDLAISSEGSFGPDPVSGLGSMNDEVVYLLDKKNKREFFGRFLSSDTNLSGKQIESDSQLEDFIKKVGFPQHALIVRRFKDDPDEIIKGVRDPQLLVHLYRIFKKNFGQFYVETDMRAMHNPKRMANIKMATQNLIQKLNQLCPSCASPGFQVVNREQGLPCRMCGTPTAMTLSHKHNCDVCGHEHTEMYPYQEKYASPQYCNQCNP